MNTGAERATLMIAIANECLRQLYELGVVDDDTPLRGVDVQRWLASPVPDLPEDVRIGAVAVTLVGIARRLEPPRVTVLDVPDITFRRAVRHYAGGRDGLLARVYLTKHPLPLVY